MFFEKFQRPSIRILPNWSFEAVAGPGVNLHFVRDPLLFQNSLQMVSLLHRNLGSGFPVRSSTRHYRRQENFHSFGYPPEDFANSPNREREVAVQRGRVAP